MLLLSKGGLSRASRTASTPVIFSSPRMRTCWQTWRPAQAQALRCLNHFHVQTIDHQQFSKILEFNIHASKRLSLLSSPPSVLAFSSAPSVVSLNASWTLLVLRLLFGDNISTLRFSTPPSFKHLSLEVLYVTPPSFERLSLGVFDVTPPSVSPPVRLPASALLDPTGPPPPF